MPVKKLKHHLIWLSIFSVSMAFLESAVVVYLRKIYYPDGFDFPLSPIGSSVAITELIRELATLIMLFSISFITGKTLKQRFAYFLLCFAIWDIFYYLFLYLLIGWPPSLLTWDILFLLPITWVGPVIAPIIVSLTMIGAALYILFRKRKDKIIRLDTLRWIFFIAGSFLIFLAFVWDYSSFILENYSVKELWNLTGDPALFDISYNYIPRHFNWFLFIAGELIVFTGIILLGTRKRKF